VHKNKYLILITSSYPNARGEEFIEEEIPYLLEKFEEILIVCNSPKTLEKELDPRIRVVYYPYQSVRGSLKSLFGLSSLIFWKEIFSFIRLFKKAPGIQVFKAALISLYNGKKLESFLEKLLKKGKLIDRNELFTYSYWLNDAALGLILLKEIIPGVKTVSRAHGWDVYFEQHPNNYLPYRSFLFNKLDKICFISDHGKKYTENKFGKRSNFMVSYLGISNTSEFKKNCLTEKLNLVSCSAIIPLKRILAIISSLAEINDIKINWKHIGDGVEKEETILQAKEMLDNKENIEFDFPGYFPNEEIKRFYSENIVHAFINVSAFEGIPVTFMEAMSFGIPVIAPNVGGISEIVNQYNGILMSPAPSKIEIADSIRTLVKMNREEYGQLRRNAYETWNLKFNASTNYTKFVEMICN